MKTKSKKAHTALKKIRIPLPKKTGKVIPSAKVYKRSKVKRNNSAGKED